MALKPPTERPNAEAKMARARLVDRVQPRVRTQGVLGRERKSRCLEGYGGASPLALRFDPLPPLLGVGHLKKYQTHKSTRQLKFQPSKAKTTLGQSRSIACMLLACMKSTKEGMGS